MRVLVIGATGFIGYHVTRRFREKGYEVRVLHRKSSRLDQLSDLDVERVVGDVGDAASIEAAAKGCEALIHCAGRYPRLSFGRARQTAEAVHEMRGLLDAARRVGVRRVVYTSSLSTIGLARNGQAATETTPYDASMYDSTYWVVKRAMEIEALEATRRGIEVVVLCPTVVFGERDVKPTSGRIILDLARGRIPGFVEGRTNLVDVYDVAEAHVLAFEKGKSGERYIIAERNIALSEFIRLVSRMIGREPPCWQVPLWTMAAMSRASELWALLSFGRPRLPHMFVDFVRYGQFYNAAKSVRDLGLTYRPAVDGLRRSVEWFRSQRRI